MQDSRLPEEGGYLSAASPQGLNSLTTKSGMVVGAQITWRREFLYFLRFGMVTGRVTGMGLLVSCLNHICANDGLII